MCRPVGLECGEFEFETESLCATDEGWMKRSEHAAVRRFNAW